MNVIYESVFSSPAVLNMYYSSFDFLGWLARWEINRLKAAVL